MKQSEFNNAIQEALESGKISVYEHIERIAFRNFYEKNYHGLMNLTFSRVGGEYLDRNIEMAWRCWKQRADMALFNAPVEE